MDTQRVVVFGKGLGSVPVNTPAAFTILTQNAGVGDLRCSIKGGVSSIDLRFFRLIPVMVSSSADVLIARSLLFFSFVGDGSFSASSTEHVRTNLT